MCPWEPDVAVWQVELFIIRLSRKSGIPGLAGMAFVSSLAPRSGILNSAQNGVLLVRPLLDFNKQDLIIVSLLAHLYFLMFGLIL